LTRGSQETDTQAETDFKLLVETYKDKVFNTVIGLVQNAADAEDLSQDVFVKVFERLENFRNESSIGTWIYRIAVTTAIDFLRMKKRRRSFSFIQVFTGKQAEDIYPTEFDHPGIIAEKKEDAKQLFSAIRSLPENQQTAFILQKTEGLSQPEIAEIMKISVGAVESLLSRAKQNLKKILTEYYSS
jgi:RNA polymerase sigma factor (sigma-70 family)